MSRNITCAELPSRHEYREKSQKCRTSGSLWLCAAIRGSCVPLHGYGETQALPLSPAQCQSVTVHRGPAASREALQSCGHWNPPYLLSAFISADISALFYPTQLIQGTLPGGWVTQPLRLQSPGYSAKCLPLCLMTSYHKCLGLWHKEENI